MVSTQHSREYERKIAKIQNLIKEEKTLEGLLSFTNKGNVVPRRKEGLA